MSRALIVVHSDRDRARAAKWASSAPIGCRIEFKASKRSLPQNSKLWASLSDIASQVVWHGQRLSPGDWKTIFTAALKRELRLVPNLDGDGFVNLGVSTSDLSKDEFAQLLELIAAFGAQRGVTFNDPQAAA